jgi:hypothetical protein
MPAGRFDAPEPVGVDDAGDLVARFAGDDGRHADFPLARLAVLPGWVEPLGRAFAARVGSAGSLRTYSSAIGVWRSLVQFMDYLSELPRPPADPSQLRLAHVRAYQEQLAGRNTSERNAWQHFRRAGLQVLTE